MHKSFYGKNAHFTKMEPCAPDIRVKLPNNKTMSNIHVALIDIPNIPLTARKWHIFPDMDSKALLSIAQFF